MRGRRGWVLLLLAAVFAMHGLHCAAAESSAPSGAHGTIHAVDHMTTPPLAAAVTAATAGVPLGVGHDSTPHGAGHLWALCLAVLAAGLAVLLLALVRRSTAIRLPLLRRATGQAWEWLSPPQPPDLYSLCLMRI
jgi:hypothetical protein